jgi:hypothetical protein
MAEGDAAALGQEHAPAVARAGDRFQHSTGMDACLRFGDLPVRGPRGLSVAVGQGEQPRGRPAIAWLRLSDTGSATAGGMASVMLATSGLLARAATRASGDRVAEAVRYRQRDRRRDGFCDARNLRASG